MPTLPRHRIYYRVKPGLRAILKEASIPAAVFQKTVPISKDTYNRIRRGSGLIGEKTRIMVNEAVRQACIKAGLSEKQADGFFSRTQALWSQVPYGEVLIHGNAVVRVRLKELARSHGMTRFEYFAKLLETQATMKTPDA